MLVIVLASCSSTTSECDDLKVKLEEALHDKEMQKVCDEQKAITIEIQSQIKIAEKDKEIAILTKERDLLLKIIENE